MMWKVINTDDYYIIIVGVNNLPHHDKIIEILQGNPKFTNSDGCLLTVDSQINEVLGRDYYNRILYLMV